jgi:hypothetical protein
MSDLHDRLEKLDDTFIFTIGFVGLLFTAIQFYEGGIKGLVLTSPLLISGIVLPFYVGYVRGTIEYGYSLTERVRGWTYLVVGFSTYVGVLLVPYSIYYYFLTLFLGIAFLYFLEKWLNRVFGMDNDVNNLYALSGTTVSGFFLAFVFGYIARLYLVLSVLIQFPTVLLSLLFLIEFFFSVFLVFEKMSRQLVNRLLPLTEEEVKRRQNERFIIRLGRCVGELSSLWFSQDMRTTYFLVATGAFSVAGFLSLSLVAIHYNAPPIIPDLLIVLAMTSCAMVTILFLKAKEIDFSKLNFEQSGKRGRTQLAPS